MKKIPGYISPCLPYIAVGTGLYVFGSAWAAMISYHLLMLLFVLAFGNKEYFDKRRNAFSRWWYLSTVVFISGGAIFYLVLPYICPSCARIGTNLENFGVNKKDWMFFAVYFCLVNSLIEELFWRGYLGSDRKHPVIEDIAFGGYHSLVLIAFVNAIWTLPVLIACAFAGWLWRMMRTATGNLVLPIVTHLGADVSIIMAVHLRLFT